MRAVKLASGDTIEVRPIGWRAWRSLREEFAQVLRSEQLGELIDGVVTLMASETANDTGEVAADLLLAEAESKTPAGFDWMKVMPKLVEGLASGAGLVATLLGDVTEQIVLGCTALKTEQLDDLSAADVLLLRQSAVDETDVPGLLGAEGNFFAGLLAMAGQSRNDA
jgi:hypothetical protein